MKDLNYKHVLLVSFLLFSVLTIKGQNYDESKVHEFTLPPLLETTQGEMIVNTKQWKDVRRPEILKLFEENVYGQVPKDFDKINFSIINKNEHALNGDATYKEVDIEVYRNNDKINIRLFLFVPNNISKPAPTFLVINHRGVKTMDVTRENRDDFWPVEEVISSGYALAGFDVIDVAPDHKVDYSKEVLEKLYPEHLGMKNGMRALGAWGWGASRIIDYFETDQSVDATKVVVVGHSRGGKAALWCGAQDERVAIAISNESGNSGAKISRRNYGESVERITQNFPYWFSPNYRDFANREDKLPIDQHMLVALIAPRGVYVAGAAEDDWADNKGQYLSLIEAQPLFRLYGFNLNLPNETPKVGEQIIQKPMGFHIREGKHNMTLFDWRKFIEFADDVL